MSINVKNNIASVNALNALNKTSRALSRSFERISTGQRISRAADDAAGLGVAEHLRAAHTSAAVAARNCNDGMSIISVAEGASAEVGSILVRMRELAIQGASETLANSERAFIQDEYVSLAAEANRISAVTEFNGVMLTDGSATTLSVQVGIQNTVNDTVSLTLGDLRATTLGVDTGTMSMATATGCSAALTNIDAAISSVSGYRSDYGAFENRMASALNNLETFGQNTLEAESRIRDADFGYETAQLSQNQILQQAGVSVLSQAKGLNQAALSLLQN